MIRRRSQLPSSLAFIDVMACGLGAVLLLFVLLKFEENVETPLPEIEDVTDDSEYQRLLSESQTLERQLSVAENRVEAKKEDVASTIIETINARSAISQPVDNAPEQFPENRDAIDQGVGDLIGLRVEGARILVLLDTSSSMAEERIIDVLVGMADATGSSLANGQKWGQAKRIVTWLVESAPNDSRLKIVSYSDTPSLLFPSWQTGSGLRAGLPALLTKLAPNGPTNLEAALDYVGSDVKDYDSIYLITDGLPTKATRATRLLNSTSCGLNITRSTPSVSGKCREALFVDSVKGFAGGGRKINVILLPFEGDPKAAPLYWKWAASTQGRIFSPDRYWP